MPFKSQAQRAFMHAKHPKIAKEFEEATPKGKKLPEHVKGSKSPVAKAKGAKAKAVAKEKVKEANAQESVDTSGLNVRKVERDVMEFSIQDKPCRVDRDKGVIYGVHLCGLESKNGGTYTRECLEATVPMYEGAKCNINHPDRSNPGLDRHVADRFGVFHNPVVTDNGAYADLHFLKSHPLAGMVCESAERMPEALGFSQNARTIQVPDGQGGIIHESITRVRSVDLVADPATTCSIFESENPMNDPHTEGMDTDTGGLDVAEMPEATNAIENDPVDVAIDALLAKYLPEIKGANKEGRKPLLNDLKKKIDAIINALTDEVETEKEATSEGEGEGEEEQPVEESAKETKVGTPVAKDDKADILQVLDVLESAQVLPTSIRIKAMMATPEADRPALADSWPKFNAKTATTIAKPRSSSVLESAREEEKKESAVSITREQLKDDAMLLMAAGR